MTRLVVGAIAGLLVVVGLSVAVGKGFLSVGSKGERSSTPAAETPLLTTQSPGPAADGSGTGMAAMEEAARAKKYLFAFFWKTDNEQTAAMKKVFDGAVKKAADRAQPVAIRVDDPAERGIVAKFALDRAPMPLALAIAPTGAVMGGFPQKFSEAQLLDAFGTPCTEKTMKALQDGKLVFLCVQNGSTQANEEALKGVTEFKADARYAEATEVVILDPTDSAEAAFLADLKIDRQTPEAVTAFLVPPGAVVAEFKGATSKDELIAALQKANTGCGPGGCGPGGCAPKP